MKLDEVNREEEKNKERAERANKQRTNGGVVLDFAGLGV